MCWFILLLFLFTPKGDYVSCTFSRVVYSYSLVKGAPPTHVGAWSMAVLLGQPFECCSLVTGFNAVCGRISTCKV